MSLKLKQWSTHQDQIERLENKVLNNKARASEIFTLYKLLQKVGLINKGSQLR